MKYTPEERMDIGRRIYSGELSCRIAAEIYGINKHTAKRYLWLYRDTLGLPPKVGRPESLSRTVAKMTTSSSGEMTDYENMTREETLTYYDFPSEHWIKIHTNNVIERLNRQIRRRTRVVGTFPDGNSALMLVCARLRHVAGTQWGDKKYMSMKHLEALESTPDVVG